MKLSLLLLVPAALVLAPVEPVAAQRNGPRIEIHNDDDSPARLGPRHSLAEARHAITTTNHVASLLLTRDAVAMQLTDRALRDIGREMSEEEGGEDGFFARLVGNAVRSGVQTMLRRSVEYPVRDLRSVEYRGGQLVFTTEEGERIFEDVEVNDTEVMKSFSANDARAFVREFNALKARLR